jgi:hypothetical protein
LTVVGSHVTIAGMSFWEDLSSATKGYIAVAAVLMVLAIGFRACTGQGLSDPPQRQRNEQP